MAYPQSAQALDPGRLRAACSRCSLQDLCIPMSLSTEDLKILESLVETIGPLHAGNHLFRQGERFQSLYAVRSGCVKSYIDNENGEEQVLGFHLPGELVGMSGIHDSMHQCSALVLDTAMVCRLPFDELSEMACNIPDLQQQLFRLISNDLRASYSLSVYHAADERVAMFLIGFGERMVTRGFSPTHFVLPMSRQDVASYLHLSPETLSRILRQFENQGLIAASRREIRLQNLPTLEKLCPHEFNFRDKVPIT